MKNTADCIIIGGGIMGLMLARELRQAGLSIMLLERQALGRESSWAGGGILSALYPWRYADALTDLIRYSQSVYPQLAATLQQETGIDAEWLQNGLLIFDIEDVAAAQAWAEKNQILLQQISSEESQRLAPGIADFKNNAYYLPDIAQIRNPRLVKALVAWGRQNGVDYREHSSVTEIITSSGVVQGVMCRGEKLCSAKVVITAGAWSTLVGEMAGICLPVQPVKGQMLLYKFSMATVKPIILWDNFYLIPRQDGHILVGSTIEYQGFDKSTTPAAFQTLTQRAQMLMPALHRERPVAQWAGLRPGGTIADIPLISAVPTVAGLYVNAGHFRNGVVLAPAATQILVDLMLERTPVLKAAPFAL